MAKSFTERERETIRKNLMNACRQSWTQHGYKKTNIDELCKQAGISKGAFYLFFDSKEALFCDVLCCVQEEIYNKASDLMERCPDQSGVADAVKAIYRDYDENNFLYNANSSDFTVLTNKLSEEQLEKIKRSNDRNRTLFLDHPHLQFKVNPEIALSVIYALIMSIKTKDVIPYQHTAVLDFMVDHLIDDMYE